MQNQMNVTDSIKHLHQEMENESQKLKELQQKLKEAQDDLAKRGHDIPQLQRQIEDDRHAIYVDGVDAEKYKKEIARIRREQILHQGALSQINSLGRQAREHGKLTR